MPLAPQPNRRTFVAAGVGAAVAAALPARAATPKDTLVIAAALDGTVTLDPAEAAERMAGELLGNGYDRLVRTDAAQPSRVQPDLAAAWTTSADGRTYAFELKPGLKFASGHPLNAEDVAWSLQRAVRLDKAPASILAQLGFTPDNVGERVRAAGPLRLSLALDRAFAPGFVLACLAANVAAVVDRALLLEHEAGGDLGHGWLKTRCAGSGPYEIREWRAGEHVALERNEHHHGPKPRLARVVYRHVKDGSAQRLALEQGDVDVARNLGPLDLAVLKRHPAIRTTSTPAGSVGYLSLNQKNARLAKPEVREAFKWLVDYASLGERLLEHVGVVHQNFLPVGLLGAVKDRPYRLDVERAKALLAKAGHARGLKVTMDVSPAQPAQGIAEALQQTARHAGVEIEIVPRDDRQSSARYREREHDLHLGIRDADYWDPHTNAATFARNPDNSDNATARTLAWRNAWEIPDLSRQTFVAVLERDTTKRAAMYAAIQAEFRRASPFVMLYQGLEVAAMRADVEGFAPGPTPEMTLLQGVRKR
jgi:peptide/nickel transport system substrate-binding protein